MLNNPVGIALLTSAWFVNEMMHSEILSARMLHRGYRQIFDQFPKDFVGLFSRVGYSSALLELTDFAERGGSCFIVHGPDAQNASPQHKKDLDGKAIVPCSTVQPVDLGTYQDHLENRYVAKWTGG